MTHERWNDFLLDLVELKTKHGIDSLFIYAHDLKNKKIHYAPAFSEKKAHPLMISLSDYAGRWMLLKKGSLPDVTMEEFLTRKKPEP